MNEGQRVQVYWNFHKKLYSVRCPKERRVIDHVGRIVLRDAQFKVSQAGRKRVLREGRKNVHAYIEGTYSEFANHDGFYQRVRYNPYVDSSFVTNEGPIHEAPLVSACAEYGVFVPEGTN